VNRTTKTNVAAHIMPAIYASMVLVSRSSKSAILLRLLEAGRCRGWSKSVGKVAEFLHECDSSTGIMHGNLPIVKTGLFFSFLCISTKTHRALLRSLCFSFFRR